MVVCLGWGDMVVCLGWGGWAPTCRQEILLETTVEVYLRNGPLDAAICKFLSD